MENSNYDWRIPRKSLKEKMKYLLSSTVFSDVTISVSKGNNKKVFSVHSVFLKMASPVFERMLEGEFQENSHKIDIGNTYPVIFSLFLEFIYLEWVDLKSCWEACELFKLGHAYLVEPMQQFCLDYLFHNLSPSTVLDAYNLGYLYDISCLMIWARRIMVRKMFEFVSSEDFVCADESLILSLLDEPSLNISQYQLFKSIEKWIEFQPEKRSLYDVIAKKFYYLEMSPEEFVNGPSQSNLLTSEQKIGFYQNMLSKDASTLPEGFHRRNPCLYIANILDMKIKHFRSGCIVLTCDENIIITAVEISTRECCYTYKETFFVIICYKEENAISADSTTQLQLDVKGAQTQLIKLRKPIQITPGREYKIAVALGTRSDYRLEVANLIDTALECHGVNFHFTRYDAVNPFPLQSIHFLK